MKHFDAGSQSWLNIGRTCLALATATSVATACVPELADNILIAFLAGLVFGWP